MFDTIVPGPDEEEPDRRGLPRRPARRRVHLEPGAIEGLTGDLSVGGVFVITGHVREPGSPVQVTFVWPQGEVRVNGLVRWVRHAPDPDRPNRAAGMGIEFVPVPERPAGDAAPAAHS